MQPRLLRSPARLAGPSLLRTQRDDRLVALVRDGHQQAFAAIVDRYGRPLERYAARLVGAGRAEDAVQQAFASAHTALVESDRCIELRPWLYRIVHNAAMNTLRQGAEVVPLMDDATGFAQGGAGSPDEAVERGERLRAALGAVAGLPPAQRDAVVLRELEGRSHDEIAAVLGVTPGAARQHLFRARSALRAAASAVVPQPVVAKVLEHASGGSGDMVAGAGAAAGTGVVALLAKAGTGVLVTGAVVAGAVEVRGHGGPVVRERPAAVAGDASPGRSAVAAPRLDSPRERFVEDRGRRHPEGDRFAPARHRDHPRAGRHDGPESRGLDDGRRHSSGDEGGGDRLDERGGGDDRGRSGGAGSSEGSHSGASGSAVDGSHRGRSPGGSSPGPSIVAPSSSGDGGRGGSGSGDGGGSSGSDNGGPGSGSSSSSPSDGSGSGSGSASSGPGSGRSAVSGDDRTSGDG